MKKSDINPEDLLKDLNNAVNLINQIENLDFNKINIKKLKKDAEKIDASLKEKYKDVLEEDEEYLDSEE